MFQGEGGRKNLSHTFGDILWKQRPIQRRNKIFVVSVSTLSRFDLKFYFSTLQHYITLAAYNIASDR